MIRGFVRSGKNFPSAILARYLIRAFWASFLLVPSTFSVFVLIAEIDVPFGAVFVSFIDSHRRVCSSDSQEGTRSYAGKQGLLPSRNSPQFDIEEFSSARFPLPGHRTPKRRALLPGWRSALFSPAPTPVRRQSLRRPVINPPPQVAIKSIPANSPVAVDLDRKLRGEPSFSHTPSIGAGWPPAERN